MYKKEFLMLLLSVCLSLLALSYEPLFILTRIQKNILTIIISLIVASLISEEE
jgi:hypothetical protein